MPNFAYKVKTTNPSPLETVYLYKLDPASSRGTEYIAIKVKRIENKFFPEKDFLDVYYAPASKSGEVLSDFNLIQKIESDKSGLSSSDLLRRYPGIGSAKAIKDTFEEYTEKYNSEPLIFDKILKHFQQQLKNALPDERDGLNSMIEIMRSISGKEPGSVGGIPRQENPDLKNAIETLLSRIQAKDGNGYVISTQKPPRKLELESTKKLMSFVSKLIKENNKFMYYLNEAEEEKKRRRPLEMGDAPPIETEKTKEAPRASNRFRKLEMDDEGSKQQQEQQPEDDEFNLASYQADLSRVSSTQSSSDPIEALKSDPQKMYTFRVVYAGDSSGNPTTIDKCEFCILEFNPAIGISHFTNLRSGSSGQSLQYVMIWKGMAKEITGNSPQAGIHYYLNKDQDKKVLNNIYKDGRNSNFVGMMVNAGGRVPCNPEQYSASSATGYISDANMPFLQKQYNPKDPSNPIITAKTLRGTVDIIKAIMTPFKNGGLGSASRVEFLPIEKGSKVYDYANKFSNKVSQMMTLYTGISSTLLYFDLVNNLRELTNLISVKKFENEVKLKQKNGTEKDIIMSNKFFEQLKELEQYYSDLKNIISDAATDGISKQELESHPKISWIHSYKQKITDLKLSYVGETRPHKWIDAGYRLIPNQFTAGNFGQAKSGGRKLEIDTNDKPIASKPTEEETVDLEDLLV